jgi:hypothetical protein
VTVAAAHGAQMSGTEGGKLVRAVITRLAQEGEEDWFGWVCCELTVQVGKSFHYWDDEGVFVGPSADWVCYQLTVQIEGALPRSLACETTRAPLLGPYCECGCAASWFSRRSCA